MLVHKPCDVPSLPTTAFDKPFAVSASDIFMQFMKDESCSHALDNLKKVWQSSALRKQPGRAGMNLLDPARAAAQAMLLKAAGSHWVSVPGSSTDLQNSTSPSLFAVTAGRDSAFLERDGLPSLRLTLQGVREVVLVPALEVHRKRYPDQAPLAVQPKDLSNMCDFCLNMTAAVTMEMKECVHFATLGPHDLLYVPAGWLVCESAQGGSAAADVRRLVQLRPLLLAGLAIGNLIVALNVPREVAPRRSIPKT